MRMPILSYFLFVGTALVGLLFLVSAEIEPNSSPLKVSQMVGVPAPFKALPEELHSRISATNFAVEYERSVGMPVQAVDAAPKQRQPATIIKY